MLWLNGTYRKMTIYNMTFVDNSTNIGLWADGVNTASSGLYAILILVVIYFVCFIAMKKYDMGVVFLVSNFINSILAIFMFIKEWIGVEILVIPLVLTLIGVFYVAFTD